MSLENYANALRSGDLRGRSIDTLGAAGLAGKRHALAHLVARMLAGDTHAHGDVVEVLAARALEMGTSRSAGLRRGMRRVDAVAVAQAVVASFTSSCKPCSGRGYAVVRGAPVLDAGRACADCGGTGRPALRLGKHQDIGQALAAMVDGCTGVFTAAAARARG